MERDWIVEEEQEIFLHLEDELRSKPMWRVYFFDSQMNIVEIADRLTTRKPTAYAAAMVKSHGWYTYAIGALR